MMNKKIGLGIGIVALGCIVCTALFFYFDRPGAVVLLDSATQQYVVTNLLENKVSADFAKSISESLPEKIGNYTLVRSREYMKKMNESFGEASADSDSEGIDGPILETYNCLSGEESCQEQVWATYENETRTTRVIFTHVVTDKAATLETLVSQVKKNFGSSFYVLKEKYVVWLPRDTFDTVMTRNTPSDNGLDADTSASDSVTKYFLATFPSK